MIWQIGTALGVFIIGSVALSAMRDPEKDLLGEKTVVVFFCVHCAWCHVDKNI